MRTPNNRPQSVRAHMRRLFRSTPLLLLLVLGVLVTSIYKDIGSESWIWFQRSGAVLVLIGAVLGYRSVVRLGIGGVGGAPVLFAKGTVVSVDDSGPVQTMKVSYDTETEERFLQHELDKVAGYTGAWLMALGTLVWGYGDLLGRLL